MHFFSVNFAVGERSVRNDAIDGPPLRRHILLFERSFGHVATSEAIQQKVSDGDTPPSPRIDV